MKLIVRRSLIAFWVLSGLGLSACSNGQQTISKTDNNKNANLKIVKHKSKPSNTSTGNLSANQISPKENVSIITIYAAHKYGNEWQKVLNSAKRSTLNVGLENRDMASANYRGQGYIYQVSAGNENSDVCYTISGEGISQIVYLYQENKYLGSSTVGEIIDYLNKLNCDAEVKSLMNRVQIGSQTNNSNNSQKTDQDNSNSKIDSNNEKSNIPGDAGLFVTPSEIRGTWYDNSGEKLVMGSHSYSTNEGTIELHKQNPNFSDKEKLTESIQNKTKTIGAANLCNIYGFKCMRVAGWTQIDGSRSLYAGHTEKNQPVLLIISSAGGLQDIFWQSSQLAHKYANTKFSDLKKLGGIMN